LSTGRFIDESVELADGTLFGLIYDYVMHSLNFLHATILILKSFFFLFKLLNYSLVSLVATNY